jgi:hypothetical protein
MQCPKSIGSIVLAGALAVTLAVANAYDDSQYPDWKGQWVRIGGGAFDPSKPAGRRQLPPLTAEYQAIWEAHMAEEAAGGQDYNPQVRCLPGGMPRLMIAYEPMEVIVTPETTYIRVQFNSGLRRIYTDGRDWPAAITPTFFGYSIGRWIDEDGDGRYDVLEVETRAMKGPRVYDASGIPLHKDNATIVKERIYLDKAKPDMLRDEITTFDHALTRPWTVMRTYSREREPLWLDAVCTENNQYVFIGHEDYLLDPEGLLMPTKKNQPPPDLKYFK